MLLTIKKDVYIKPIMCGDQTKSPKEKISDACKANKNCEFKKNVDVFLLK